MTGSATRRPWYRGRVRVREAVDCGGASHHVLWRRGRIVLEDHDVAAERAIHGLGGEKAPCIDVLEAWRALNDRPALEELSRLLWGRRGLARNEPLPSGLGRVAALATIVRCERRWDDPDFAGSDRRVVGQELSTGFGDAIKASLAGAGEPWRRRVKVRSRCEVLPPGEVASVDMEVLVARGTVTLTAELPISWLVDVWGRGLGAVDGCLVLEADADDGGHVGVAAIDWAASGPERRLDPHLIRAWAVREEQGWHLDRAAPPPRLPRRPWCSVRT